MTFFFTKSVFFAYGRPSMIFCEYFSPMPGSASSCSLVAVLMSSRSADAAAAVLLAGFDPPLTPARAIPLIRLTATKTMRIFPIRFLSISCLSLVFLRFLIASRLRFGFGHEFPALGLAIPAPTLVVNPAVQVHPHLAAGLRRSDFRTRR